MKASEWLKTKPVNVINQEWHDSDTVTVTIYKRGWRRAYKFKAKHLYTEKEKILEDEEIDEP